MTHQVNAIRRLCKKTKTEEVEDDVNERALDTSRCTVSELWQELIEFINLAPNRTIKSAGHEVGVYNCSTTVKDEATRIKKEVEFTIESVERSGFFQHFANQLRDNTIIRRNILRVLRSHLRLDMVIYGLGSIVYAYRSHYQLALALLLKRHFPYLIGEIEVYDPDFTSVDRLTLEMLGCTVLTVNEQCTRQVEKPTLFYLPHLDTKCIGDLLGANWCPARLNLMIILTNSFDGLIARHLNMITSYAILDEGDVIFDDGEDVDISSEYIRAISDLTTKVDAFIPQDYRHMFSWCTWHFFALDIALGMDLLLPVNHAIQSRLIKRKLYVDQLRVSWQPLEDQKIHQVFSEGTLELLRMPFYTKKETSDPSWPFLNKETGGPSEWANINLQNRSSRQEHCFWKPPPPSWIKLNFSLKGSGFGGIVHDEHKNCLGVYCGNLVEADPVVAGIEALRWVVENLKMISNAKKLVIEGDDFGIIRWLNRGSDPPFQIVKLLSRVFQRLERMKYVIVHVYEEANSLAAELAEKGASRDDGRLWMCTRKGGLSTKSFGVSD